MHNFSSHFDLKVREIKHIQLKSLLALLVALNLFRIYDVFLLPKLWHFNTDGRNQVCPHENREPTTRQWLKLSIQITKVNTELWLITLHLKAFLLLTAIWWACNLCDVTTSTWSASKLLTLVITIRISFRITLNQRTLWCPEDIKTFSANRYLSASQSLWMTDTFVVVATLKHSSPEFLTPV